MRMWIKNPIAILTEGAGGGVVVDDGRIVELVARAAVPATGVDRVFDASRHVVIPGLVNTHHHMFQTLTRAHPAALNKELFPLAQRAVSHLGETPQSRLFAAGDAARSDRAPDIRLHYCV